jgi:hypothetical protein
MRTPVEPASGSMMTAAMQGHQALELIGELHAVLGHAARERILCQIVGVRQVIHARQQVGRPNLAVRRDAADGDAAESHPMVAALTPDEARARSLATHALVGERDLQRGIHRLRSRIGEEHVVEPLGRDLH